MRLPSALPAALLLAAVMLAASGCVYKVDIQQGNFIDEKAVSQVEIGMTRSQVRFLLGTPMVADSFDQDRWDYVYYLRPGRTGKLIQRHLIVRFNGDTVLRLERPDGTALPAPPAPAAAEPAATPPAAPSNAPAPAPPSGG
ncbi:MAG: outer membrane protein assembly factor BamE [Gammaproteobacteria bacterium]|nr:outer membrane protein assembly factor BamE [Gammaproteobacteria bacterium]